MRQNVRVSVKRGPDDCRWRVWMADGKCEWKKKKKNIYIYIYIYIYKTKRRHSNELKQRFVILLNVTLSLTTQNGKNDMLFNTECCNYRHVVGK